LSLITGCQCYLNLLPNHKVAGCTRNKSISYISGL
jgi:hypothetical protein